jgi:hypothetical protein
MRRKDGNGAVRIVLWNFDVPVDVARCFVDDMQAWHAEKNEQRRDEIVKRQIALINQHMRCRRITADDIAVAFGALMKGDRRE